MINNWEKTLLNIEGSILQALRIINDEALRVAMIIDDDNNFVGIVTDGDVRRGLIKGIDLHDPVSQIVNRNPITLPSNSSNKDILNKMNELDILFIPLVEDNKVVGLETLHNTLTNRPSYENPVFIMAGGFGTRLRPLTDNCPKPMLKIGNKPILETVIRSFIKSGFKNFYISTHYMPEQIEAHFGNGSLLGCNIRYVFEDEPLGTGGALGLLPSDIPKDLPLIMINGDVLTKVDFERLLDFHIENKASATMCVREYDYQIPYGVVSGEGNRITSMIEKPIQKFFVNAGIYVLSPDIVNSVPKNHRIDMPTLLEKHMEKDVNVLMFPIHEYWLDIGRMDDFKRAQADIISLDF